MKWSSAWSSWPLAIVLLATAVAALAYGLAFNLNPPGQPEAWGQFGDYFGGLLNPLIGIITVVLVLRTLKLTRQEAKDTRRQMELQTQQLAVQIQHLERESRITNLKRRLDGALASWESFADLPVPRMPISDPGTGAARFSPPDQPLRVLLRKVSMSKLRVLASGEHKRNSTKEWASVCRVGIEIMGELAVYCEDFDNVSGDRLLSDYYRRRVNDARAALFALGVIDKELSDRLTATAYLDPVVENETYTYKFVASDKGTS